MPSQLLSPPTDQTNELDSLLSSVLSSSDEPSRSVGEGNPLHYGHTSNHASSLHMHRDSLPTFLHHLGERKSNLTSKSNLNFRDFSSNDRLGTSQSGSRTHSMETCLHSGVEGNSLSKQHRSAHRVHYSDSVLHLRHKPRASSSKVPPHNHMQTNLSNGIDDLSTRDYKYTDHFRNHSTTSPSSERNHKPRLSSTRNDDVITSGRGLTKEVELVDDVSDVLMVGDLDDSPLNLSDEFVDGASYDELLDDGELSDVSELLLLTPKYRPRPTSVSVYSTQTHTVCNEASFN